MIVDTAPELCKKGGLCHEKKDGRHFFYVLEFMCNYFSHQSVYGKCSKISNTSCLAKKHRQTVQTKIILLLKKQYDQGLP